MATRNDLPDTYLRDLIDFLRQHPNGLTRQRVLSELERRRRSKGLSIPHKFEEAVQNVFNQHCVQSEVLRNRNAPDEGFFYSEHDERTAIWSVDISRADAWLRTRSSLYELAQAIGRIKDVPTERALAAVEKADEAQQRNWRNSLKVRAVILQIRAEKAQEAAEREGGIAMTIESPSDERDGT